MADVKKRGEKQLEPVRPPPEPVALRALAPKHVEEAPRARVAEKGDGMTSDKPRLPSVELPAVAPPDPVRVRAQPVELGPQRPAPMRAALTRTDPVRTRAKPVDLTQRPEPARPAPLRPAQRQQPLRGLKGDGMTDTRPVMPPAPQPAPAPSAPTVPARELMRVGTAAPARLQVQSNGPASDFATQTKLPPDIEALLGDPAAFKEAYLVAKQRGESWALELAAEAVSLSEKLDARIAELEEKAASRDTRDGEGPSRDRVREDPAVRQLLNRVKDEPWLLAAAAEVEAEAARIQRISQEQAVDVAFDPGGPTAMTPAERRRSEQTDRNGRLEHPEILAAADGSMKVPEPKEKYVTEYVKTNPVVEELRRAGYGNMWNPVYAYHLSATAMAANETQGAPPQGKGYLAMTEHGFAYCWNPDLTEEQNRKVAEFSLRTGMLFERCDGMNDLDASIDGALKQLDDFDPSKPGEVKILLDRTKHGYDKISISSDGKGNVDSHYYFRPDRGEHFRDQSEKYGLAVVATVVGVVALCLGQVEVAPAVLSAWQTAATYTAAAAATQGAYSAARNGDWLGFVLSLASIYSSVATRAISDTTSTAYRVAKSVGDAANAVKGIRTTLAAVQNRDLASALGGIANVASSLATMAGTWGSGDVAADFQKLAEYADKYGKAAAFGAEGLAALQRGDYLTAFACGLQTITTATGDRNDPRVQRRLEAAAAMKGAAGAIEKGDWAGVVQHVLGVARAFGNPEDPNIWVSAGVAISGIISELRGHDPAGAAKLAAEFLQDLKAHRDRVAAERANEGDPVQATYLDRVLADIDAQLERLGGTDKLFGQVGRLQTAIAARDPAAILQAATDLAANLTRDGRVAAASRLMREAQRAIDVIRGGGSFTDLLEAGRRLGQAIMDASDVVDGDFGDAKTSLAQQRAAHAEQLAVLDDLLSRGDVSKQTYDRARQLLDDADAKLDAAERAIAEGRTSRADQLLDEATGLIAAAHKAAELRECHVDPEVTGELNQARRDFGELERLLQTQRDAGLLVGNAYHRTRAQLDEARRFLDEAAIANNDGDVAKARALMLEGRSRLAGVNALLQGEVLDPPDAVALRYLTRLLDLELPFLEQRVELATDDPASASVTGTGRSLRAELAARVAAYRDAVIDGIEALGTDRSEESLARIDLAVLEARNAVNELLEKMQREPGLLIDRDQNPQGRYQRPHGQLFVDGVSPSDVAQGGVGNCYFMAALAALAKSDPDLIRDAIVPDEITAEDEFVTVRLYDTQGQPHYEIVSLQLVSGYGGSTTAGELWPAIMEKAYAQFCGGFPSTVGGNGNRALQTLTGRPLEPIATTDVPTAELMRRIDEALEAGLPVTAATNERLRAELGNYTPPLYWDPATGLVGNHEYTVVGIDLDRGVVRVRNPWGNNIAPNDPDGRVGAEIEIPISRFRELFWGVSFTG